MTQCQRIDFELYVMDLAKGLQTASDCESLAKELHESVENAILDICLDNGIDVFDDGFCNYAEKR